MGDHLTSSQYNTGATISIISKLLTTWLFYWIKCKYLQKKETIKAETREFLVYSTSAILVVYILYVLTSVPFVLMAKSFSNEMFSHSEDKQITNRERAINNSDLSKEILKQHVTSLNAATMILIPTFEVWAKEFDPKMLLDKVRILDLTKLVDAREDAMNVFIKKLEETNEISKEKIKPLLLDDNFKSVFLSNYNQYFTASYQQFERFKKGELAFIKKNREIISFCSKANFKLSSSGQPIFSHDSDADKFNSLINEIGLLESEMDLILNDLSKNEELANKLLSQ